MKNAIIAGLLLMASVATANANVLTFEDLPGDTSALADGYGGFNWNGATTVGSITKTYHPGSGYDVGTIGNISVFNWWGNSPTDIKLAGSGTFTFNGAQFTSAWYDQTLTFEGYKNGVLVDTSSPYSITTTTPQFISLNWSGIDELKIYNTNFQWDMDNFTFNNGSAPVPEPGTMALLGLGMAGLAVYAKRRNQKA